MLDGRVKTLHPKVHGGILHRREDAFAPQRRGRARHSADRHGGGQSLRLREDRGQAGRAFRRTDRKHRHRRAVDDPLRRQEFSGCRGRDFARRLQRARRRDGRSRAARSPRPPSGGWRRRPSPPPPPTIPRSRPRWSASAPMDTSSFIPKPAFPQNLRLSFSKIMDLRYGENPHQKAAMYTDGSGAASPTAARSRARNFPTTTSWTCRRPGTWRRSLTRPSAPSSSTPTRAAPPPARLWPRPTGRRWNAIRCRLSAA